MNQMTKTLCFVGAALGSTVLAFSSRPRPVNVESAAESVVNLCPDFKDPLDAKSLKIVRFDETLASVSEIEIKEADGIWTLPSHDGYPADAENRIRDATTPFIELKSIASVSDNDGDHSLYGVLEPGADKSSVGDQGVGTLVAVKDGTGKNLVNLIIGKEVKDDPELRYARHPDRSRVYVAKVDPNNLPVRFEDWIDKDLLQLNTFDIQQLQLRDYSFQVAATLQGLVTDYDQRLEVTMSDENGTWSLDELKLPVGSKLQPSDLAENEELNKQRLDSLKEALDGLEIVNVERKPANLGADLRADKGFANDEAGLASLQQRGFYPVSMPSGEIEVLSADGEVRVRTKEGVEYVLRFGGVEGVDTESDEGKLNRFLLVTARVNETQFPQPELDPVPESVDDLKRSEAERKAASPPGEENTSRALPSNELLTRSVALLQETDESEPGSDVSDESATPAETGDDVATDPAAEPVDQVDDTQDTQETPAAQDAEVTSEEAPQESPADAPVATDEGATNEDATDEGSVQTEAETEAADVDWEARLEAERERITKENQRKIDERKEKLATAQTKVRELNYRFADWYYVISEDMYKQIHLSHTDIIQEKGADAAEEGPNALRNLPPQGLEGLFPGGGAP